MTDTIDPELAKNGDTRNVVDAYKTWKIAAIKNDMQKRSFPLHIAIENYQHDFNIGTIVRNANAFNVSGVHIIGKRHWNRRGAMATEKYLELYNHASIEDFHTWTKENNLMVVGIDNTNHNAQLHTYVFPESCVLLFGQEGPGLSVEAQKICKDIVEIEQFGSTRSINVGVASGIIMYQWLKTYRFKNN